MLLTVAVVGVALGAPSADALSVKTPVLDVDVGADQNGVDVGASVPGLGTEVDANVGVGEGGVDVGVDVNTPAGDVNAQVGQPGSPGGGSGSGDTGTPTSGSDSASGGGSSQSGAGTTISGDAKTSRDGTTSRGGRTRSSKRARESRSAAAKRQAAESLGPLALLSGEAPAAAVKSPRAEGESNNSSVVAKLVAYIPTWLWVLFGLVVAALLATLAFAVRERRRRHAADRLAMRDPLTGIANVKAFDDRMSQEWARARRYGGELGLLLIDLDGFKEVNDRHGHAAGDEVLIATAEQLRVRTRESDMVARIGGDEFAVICPHTGVKGLRKLRRQLEKSLPDEIGYDVGLSIGVAAMRPADGVPSETVARADSAMYARKALRKERSGDLVAAR